MLKKRKIEDWNVHAAEFEEYLVWLLSMTVDVLWRLHQTWKDYKIAAQETLVRNDEVGRRGQRPSASGRRRAEDVEVASAPRFACSAVRSYLCSSIFRGSQSAVSVSSRDHRDQGKSESWMHKTGQVDRSTRRSGCLVKRAQTLPCLSDRRVHEGGYVFSTLGTQVLLLGRAGVQGRKGGKTFLFAPPGSGICGGFHFLSLGPVNELGQEDAVSHGVGHTPRFPSLVRCHISVLRGEVPAGVNLNWNANRFHVPSSPSFHPLPPDSRCREHVSRKLMEWAVDTQHFSSLMTHLLAWRESGSPVGDTASPVATQWRLEPSAARPAAFKVCFGTRRSSSR